jgi:hypothetical protein
MNAILMFLRATDIRLRCVRCMPKIAAAVFEVERVSSNGGHAHIQAVPVPLRLESRLESAFLDGGKLQGIEFDVEEAGAPSSDHRVSYSRVKLHGGRRLVHRITVERVVW